MSQMACNKPEKTVISAIRKYNTDSLIVGADLSYSNYLEDLGTRYRDSSKIKDVFSLFSDRGCNVVRVRLWVNPKWQEPLYGTMKTGNFEDVKRTMQRAKANGMKVLLDFHYSDTWADPAHQETPAEWKNLNFQQLISQISTYTSTTLNNLKSENLIPDFIQIGNENNNGMCWPLGKTIGNNFQAFATLLNAGLKSVDDFNTAHNLRVKKIIHVAQFQDATPWLINIKNAGVTNYDIIGISHYAKWSQLKDNTSITTAIKTIKTTYAKDVLILETAYPHTSENYDSYGNIIGLDSKMAGYDYTTIDQERYYVDLTQAVIDGGGLGIISWEPSWVSNPQFMDRWGTGSSWENTTFFDVQKNALPVFNYMSKSYRF